MLPKFSIRQLLWGTLVFAFLAIGIAAAYRGNMLAYGLVLAPVLMVVPFLVMAAVYWVSFSIGALFFKPIHSAESSSFAETLPTPNPSERPAE